LFHDRLEYDRLDQEDVSPEGSSSEMEAQRQL
jgi:hypothetical protein